MSKVKCDHCGLYFEEEECVPCYWDEIDKKWYHCKKCKECFTNGGVIKFENGSKIETVLKGSAKSMSIRGQRSNHATWFDEVFDIK